jgi:surface carbohydrate biosynthesis protein
MQNILNFLFIVLKARLEFKIIKKKDILIYDEYTAEYAKSFFKESSTELLDIRYNRINLLILLKSLIDKICKKELTLSQIYILNYIEQCSPKCVITFQDQHNFFWNLKKYFLTTKFIIVQSSFLAPWYLNSFYTLKKNKINNKKYKIDLFFVYGEGYKKIFSKYFDSKFITIGSFRNNIVENTKRKINDLIFISQYKFKNKEQLMLNNKTHISAADYFYKADQLVINFLVDYCKKSKIKFKILLRTANEDRFNLIKEKKYFSQLLKFKNLKLKFVNKPKRVSTYHLIKKFNYFVTINSTLGYEALARGKRVAFLHIRKNIANILSYENFRFGWPNIFPRDKYFWTDSAKSRKMENALNYIYKCNEINWKKIERIFVNPLIIYDHNNQIFFKEIKKIGISL